MSKSLWYLLSGIAVLPIIFLGLMGCSDRLQQINVPADVFTLNNEVVAIRAEWESGRVMTREISLDPLLQLNGKLSELILLQYKTGAPFEIPFTRKKNHIVADLVGGNIYLLFAKPIGSIHDIYGVFCILDRHREFIDQIKPDLQGKLCKLILCSPERMPASEIFRIIPEASPLSERIDYGSWMVGGLDSNDRVIGVGGVCERCKDVLKPGLIYPAEYCWNKPGKGFDDDGCNTVIFQDDFDADVAGNPPSTTPAGNPVDDSLNLQGGSNTIQVVDAAPHGSRAVRIDRGENVQTVFDAVVGDGPHTSGTYLVTFKGYNLYSGGNTPSLTVSVKSSTEQTALKLLLDNNQYRLVSGAGTELLTANYTLNVVDNININIDMSAGTFSVYINGSNVASGKPFMDSEYTDLKKLSFGYPPAILEAFPAIYIADEIRICKQEAFSGYRGTVFERQANGEIGGPVAEAEMRFIPESGGQLRKITADATGRYAITLAPGRYTVMASHQDYEDYSSSPGFFVVSGGGYQTGNFFLRGPRVTTAIIVRHADRDGVLDALTPAGEQRALQLSRVTRTAPIAAVYSTNYQRTRLTAEPSANAVGMEIESYSNYATLATTVMQEHEGDTVLIVGHSNTVTRIVEAMGGQNYYPGNPNPDINDFDNIFIVSRPTSGNSTSVLNLQYGADTGPDVSNLSRDGLTTIIALPPAEISGGVLTSAGEVRVNALSHMLAKSGVTEIYTANTTMALSTATSVSNDLGITAIQFNEANVAGLMSQIDSNHAGESVVVIASKDVLSNIVNTLAGKPVPIVLANEHDALLVIQRLNAIDTSVTYLKYGAQSP